MSAHRIIPTNNAFISSLAVIRLVISVALTRASGNDVSRANEESTLTGKRTGQSDTRKTPSSIGADGRARPRNYEQHFRCGKQNNTHDAQYNCVTVLRLP